MKLLWTFLSSLLVFSPTLSWAAACCGGGVANPSVIANDDKAQVTSSISHTNVVVDSVDSRGVWYKSQSHAQVQTYRIEGAHIIKDRWQAGGVIPVVQRTQFDQTHSGLGDISATLGYEYLPDWDYNPLRPKGIGFLQLTAPTGKSRAEAENGWESRGNGFWAFGVGTLLTKTFEKWDGFLSFEIHRSFSKAFGNSQFRGTLHPGNGGNLGVGAGYNLEKYRIGSALTWTYEDPVKIDGTFSSKGSAERYATALLSVSYLPNSLWIIVGSFSDQTILGSPVNTSLGRTVMLQLQRRWVR